MYPDYNMYNPYYGFNDFNYRGGEPTTTHNEEIITLYQAVELIRKSVGDERSDEIFYETLINQATTEKEKEIISSIRDDERKHNQILRELYYNLTGKVIPVETGMVTETSKLDYKGQLEKALFGELEAVVKYRRILGTMPSGESYTLIMSIMTDELRHASKYNFLIHNAN
jgi:rubrerythrin